MLPIISPCLRITYLCIKTHLDSLETNSISNSRGRREGGPQGGGPRGHISQDAVTEFKVCSLSLLI